MRDISNTACKQTKVQEALEHHRAMIRCNKTKEEFRLKTRSAKHFFYRLQLQDLVKTTKCKFLPCALPRDRPATSTVINNDSTNMNFRHEMHLMSISSSFFSLNNIIQPGQTA